MPPPVLVATPGAANANVYATLAEANAYHEAHLHGAAWREALVEDKQRALLTATRLLDQHVAWYGSPASTAQPLAWPRTGLYDRNGADIASTALPRRLVEGCAELARQLLAGDRTADSEIETKGLTSLTVGSIAMSFRDGVTPKVIPDAVAALVETWGVIAGRSGIAVPLVRV